MNYFRSITSSQCYSMLNSNLRKKIIALFSLKQAVVLTGLRIYQIIHEFPLFKECVSITPVFHSFYKRYESVKICQPLLNVARYFGRKLKYTKTSAIVEITYDWGIYWYISHPKKSDIKEVANFLFHFFVFIFTFFKRPININEVLRKPYNIVTNFLMFG